MATNKIIYCHINNKIVKFGNKYAIFLLHST